MQGRLLKDYRTYLKIERAMSLNTVASYCSDVGKFLDGLDGVSPEKVVADDIVTFLKGMDGMSERTQARFVSALRSFYRWMVLEGSEGFLRWG